MRYQAALHSVGGDAIQSAKQNHTTPMAQCRLLGSYPVRDPRSRQTVIAARSTAAGCIKTLVNQPLPVCIGGPLGETRTHTYSDNPARLPIPPRGVYSVICLAGVSLPPSITKVYHKLKLVSSRNGGSVSHPFKSRSTSSSTSVFVTRYLYVEILAGWLNPTDMSEIGT